MRAKEKAIELYNNFRNENSVMTSNIRAKKQAYICVKEVISEIEDNYDTLHSGYRKSYWQQVLTEIENL